VRHERYPLALQGQVGEADDHVPARLVAPPGDVVEQCLDAAVAPWRHLPPPGLDLPAHRSVRLREQGGQRVAQPLDDLGGVVGWSRDESDGDDAGLHTRRRIGGVGHGVTPF
jgi:hypothetical protein